MKGDAERIWMGVLSIVILAGTFFVSWYILTVDELSSEKSQVAYLILGYTYGLSQSIVGYYFMSSKGSRDKTVAIQELMLKQAASQEEESNTLVDNQDDFINSIDQVKRTKK